MYGKTTRTIQTRPRGSRINRHHDHKRGKVAESKCRVWRKDQWSLKMHTLRFDLSILCQYKNKLKRGLEVTSLVICAKECYIQIYLKILSYN